MTQLSPLVTVIIPTYNCEAYIDETLGSVLGQTVNNIEVLVVDDGSTDRTREIVAGYSAPVRLIIQQNARVCAARNNGIRQARGKFICLLDHDDYWFPDKLERQLTQMRAHPNVGVVYSSFLLWHRDKDGVFPSPLSFDLSAWTDGVDADFSGWIYHQFMLDCWMLTSAALFRREVFENCGYFDEALPYSEDWELWIRIAQQYPFIKLNRPDTLYRQHPSQGNRVVRPIDYRTRLLIESEKKWGLCSKDGRCVDRDVFKHQLAAYHAQYGMHHLQVGHVRQALASLWKAWLVHPSYLKYPAYILAALVGWRPNWE
jgi:hypothetical protein